MIQRPSLHAELTDRLRHMVIEDQLSPGEKIPEKDLCALFGVSRTPLREALKVLASEGLVVLEVNRGARVAEVTVEELDKTFPVLALLEQLVGELAASSIDDDGIAAVTALHDSMLAAFRAGDRPTYFQANQDIHSALLAAAGNDVLESHHRLVATRVLRARFMVNMSDTRWAEAIAEHEEMLTHLSARDGEALGQVMKRHMLNKYRALKAALAA
ncbi:MAG: GntR family transcriptional regulator [Pseudomonadota bacterium]